MSYKTFTRKVETSLDAIVDHIQTNVNNAIYFHPYPKAHYVILPELYIAKGLREIIMLLADPAGRAGMYISRYRNRSG